MSQELMMKKIQARLQEEQETQSRMDRLVFIQLLMEGRIQRA